MEVSFHPDFGQFPGAGVFVVAELKAIGGRIYDREVPDAGFTNGALPVAGDASYFVDLAAPAKSARLYAVVLEESYDIDIIFKILVHTHLGRLLTVTEVHVSNTLFNNSLQTLLKS
jgi:hypothetical protein